MDLDFFVPQSFLAEDLRPRLAKAGQFSPITVRNDSIVCRLDAVQWRLFKYEYPPLETPKRCHPIRIASVRDITAMKVVGIYVSLLYFAFASFTQALEESDRVFQFLHEAQGDGGSVGAFVFFPVMGNLRFDPRFVSFLKSIAPPVP